MRAVKEFQLSYHTGLCGGYTGIMENIIETTIYGEAFAE